MPWVLASSSARCTAASFLPLLATALHEKDDARVVPQRNVRARFGHGFGHGQSDAVCGTRHNGHFSIEPELL